MYHSGQRDNPFKKGHFKNLYIQSPHQFHINANEKSIRLVFAKQLKVNFEYISRTLHCYLATLRIAGALQRSTEVMKAMQQLIKIPEVAATMRDLSKEMMKVLYILVIS